MPFEKVGQIQTFNIQIGVYQEIHVILVHDYQCKSDRNQ